MAGDDARGAETVIQGSTTVTASGTVDIDGVRIENTSDNAHAFTGVLVNTSADVTIENSVFYSPVANGGTPLIGLADRAIYVNTVATGHVTIADDFITGASVAKYGNASWATGIWSDGAASALDVTGNTFQYVRTAMNLDSYKDASTHVGGNLIETSGSGISMGGVPTGSAITGIHDNVFQDVDTDFNLRNIDSAHPQSFDLSSTNNTAIAGGADPIGQMYVLGTAGPDTFTGSAGSDILDARDVTGGAGFTDTTSNTLSGLGGNDTLLGSLGNDTLNGGDGNDTLFGSAGADTMTGGLGADTFKFVAVTDSSPGAGHDTITDFTPGTDKIDLSAIDANTASSGQQHFTFVDNPTPAVNPGVQANSVTWYQDGVHNETIIQADNNGNAVADMEIHLSGLKALAASDFILA